MTDVTRFGVRGGAGTKASFEAEYAAAADRVLRRTGQDAFDAMRQLDAASPGRYQPENGAAYPRSPYGQALKQIAQLVKADVGLEVAFAESTQWDHHANEGGATGQLANRLADFAQGIAALVTDLGSRMQDVVILTMSEFGRAVAENGNRGTDHGHANAMFIVGGAVKGGKVYGRWPGLAPAQRHEGRDLAVTTDFRDVFSEVAVRHLGVKDVRAVFPGYAVSAARFPGFLSWRARVDGAMPPAASNPVRPCQRPARTNHPVCHSRVAARMNDGSHRAHPRRPDDAGEEALQRVNVRRRTSPSCARTPA